jgi:hypothetical protein
VGALRYLSAALQLVREADHPDLMSWLARGRRTGPIRRRDSHSATAARELRQLHDLVRSWRRLDRAPL